ncbi:MAG: hypothetical protein ABI415_03065 [Flavitalea sp.]
MNLRDHEAWEMKPRKLTADEIANPEKVIIDFFEFAHLPQARWMMWEGMKTLVTGSYPSLKARERTSLIYFYEQLERLIEVSHVLYETRKPG